MAKNSILKKFVIVCLILNLTFANFAFTGQAIAASIFDGLFSSSKGTGNKNVEFNAGFKLGDTMEKEIEAEVNSEDLKLAFDVMLMDEGYIKDGKISIYEAEENQGFNFSLPEEFEDENVEKFENNELYLERIEGNEERIIEIPIEYFYEEFISLDKISKDFKVKFTGTYVDMKAHEYELEKEITLNLTWNNEREFNIDGEVTKFFEYTVDGEKYSTLQTLVKIDTNSERKVLPIHDIETSIELELPEESEILNVVITPKSTTATNNQKNEEIDLKTNVTAEYDEETKLVTIKTTNEAQKIEEEFNQEELIEEEKLVSEKYFAGKGVDEYLVTYTIKNLNFANAENIVNDEIDENVGNIENNEENENIENTENTDNIENNQNSETEENIYQETKKTPSVKQKIKAEITGYDQIVVEKENEKLYELSETTGENVSFEMENETESLSKGYMYYNFNNEEDKYEIRYNSTAVINISNYEFVEEVDLNNINSYYITKDGKPIEAEDIGYESVAISKENFDNLLGEEGKIDIFDGEANLLGTIDNTLEADENGFILIGVEGNLSRVGLKIYKPINDGNLNIKFNKVQKKSQFDKEKYSELDSFNDNLIVKAKYVDAIEFADVANEMVTTKLEDTKTEINLSLDREELTTLLPNENVEIKLELNNNKIESDPYGNSVFEIQLPKDIKNMEITNASLIYGDGLELANVEPVDEDSTRLRITLEGIQKELNSGRLTNGTNIIINANIELDEYSPSKQEEIKVYYYNEEATNYPEITGEDLLRNLKGVVSKNISYKAPAGIVSINKISNYTDEEKSIQSIKQGTKTDKIKVLKEAKTAKMDLIIMNNQGNDVKNVSILGRIPFVGVKDIITNEELGTTVDSKILSGITGEAGFKVYYSANGEATKDLENAENGWTENINLEEAKSFLIVPEEENYIMPVETVLRFSYEYLIPEQLEHNNEIISTFVTYYTNSIEGEEYPEEISASDIVYLTTGAGPELEVKTESDKTENVSAREQIRITSKVKNTGKDAAYNVKAIIPIPEGTTFVGLGKDEFEYINENNQITFNVGQLNIEEEKEVSIIVSVNEFDSAVENPELTIKTQSTADELGKIVESEEIKVGLIKAKISIELKYAKTGDCFTVINPEEQELKFEIKVSNLTNELQENVIVKMNIDKGTKINKVYTFDFEGETTEEKILDTYNNETGIIEWNIGDLKGEFSKSLIITLTTEQIEDNLTKKNIKMQAFVEGKDIEKQATPEYTLVVGKPVLEIVQTSNLNETYIKEGSEIIYTFQIKNVGAVMARDVNFDDKLPDEVAITKISYIKEGVESAVTTSNNSKASIVTNINPEEVIVANVYAKAKILEDSTEVTATNQASVSGENINEAKSNSITHIIEAEQPEKSTPKTYEEKSSSELAKENKAKLTKTYKISGISWLDENENGMKDTNEKKNSGIEMILINSENGVIKAKTKTNSNGEYTFSGIENGKYMIVAKYDTNKYALTIYQKENINVSANSDFIVTTIEENGNKVQGAVTDFITIQDGSVSNIDLGLTKADTFDLKLEKTINKITVQNSEGTKTIECNNTNLAKTEIASKLLDNSTVYIEYTIKVKNEGEYAGFAKKIVDYLPKDVNFNSSLKGNENWYTLTDGNLYSTALENTPIASGETKELKLVLMKQMDKENTGAISNSAEIAEDYNIYGIKDKNSIAGNKMQNENDMDTADALIGVKTGETFVTFSIITTSMLLIGIAIFVVYGKLEYKKRRGGV